MKQLYIFFENRYESVQAMQVLANDIIFYFAFQSGWNALNEKY